MRMARSNYLHVKYHFLFKVPVRLIYVTLGGWPYLYLEVTVVVLATFYFFYGGYQGRIKGQTSQAAARDANL